MKVLLRSDVDGLGRTGDLVDVARGYARNFLVPRGLAVEATAGIAAQAEAMQRKRAMHAAEDRAGAEAIAVRLAGAVLVATARASDEGRLYGSVGGAEVVAALATQVGVTVEPHQIDGEIVKNVGVHEFTVRLHPEVVVPVSVEVTAKA